MSAVCFYFENFVVLKQMFRSFLPQQNQIKKLIDDFKLLITAIVHFSKD